MFFGTNIFGRSTDMKINEENSGEFGQSENLADLFKQSDHTVRFSANLRKTRPTISVLARLICPLIFKLLVAGKNGCKNFI